MSRKISGVKKDNSRLRSKALFGIITKVSPTVHVENQGAKSPVHMNYRNGGSASVAALRAEWCKAQAITLIRQMSIR